MLTNTEKHCNNQNHHYSTLVNQNLYSVSFIFNIILYFRTPIRSKPMFDCFKKQVQPTRKVAFGRHNNPHNYHTNAIKTTKYTLLTFLPKAFILQFIRPANFVYLLTAILQSIPIISAMSPMTAIAPFIVVILVSVVREGYEDYVFLILGILYFFTESYQNYLFVYLMQKRYKNDKQANQTKTHRLVAMEFVDCQWQDIQPGDIVKIKNQETIPADILLLHSSQENGICYVETASLDGQRNLKSKNCFSSNIRLYPNELEILTGHVIIDQPNEKLHDFNGQLHINDHSVKHLMESSLLLRGTRLKNTHEAVGLVMYAGADTKIMKNQGRIRHKVSHVQRKVNVIQLVLLFVLFAMCLVCAVMYRVTWEPFGSRGNLFYLRTSSVFSIHAESALISLTSFLLLNFLVPISMNISMELLKTFQGDLLSFDAKMTYNDGTRTHCCNVLNTSIIEELGSVAYVLTDKTGTLTSNTMEFRVALVNTRQYTENTIRESKYQLAQDQYFRRFWTYVTLCHEVVVDTVQDQYQGSSADEVCFLDFAKQIGYVFRKRTRVSIEVDILNEKRVFELLLILPFTDRKMMSVVVRDLQRNEVIVVTKGADSSVLPRRSSSQQQLKIAEINLALVKFSKQGFRTLVFGTRVLNEVEAKTLLSEYQDFISKKTRKEVNSETLKQLEDSINSRFESGLEIVGVSAIQDKLQEGVPQAITRLRQADIKVAMITGDKLETAENIGLLSNFISPEAEVFRLRDHGKQDFKAYLAETLQETKKQHQDFSILIEGEMISAILKTDDVIFINQTFVPLVERCGSIIFCRSTPAQKGEIVKFFKNTFKKTVLAIGDGGNDVPMIQEADIGVGILGKQGNQVASASDFSFGQFRFLQRLVLHHGRWAYYRIAYFFVYYGFKNLLLTLVLFYFLCYCGYSGNSIGSEPYLTSYNSVLSLVLTIYYGVWEQDINGDTYPPAFRLLPKFYRQYKQLNLFSYRRYIIWSLGALLGSAFIFFSAISQFSGSVAIDAAGRVSDFRTFSSNISLSSILMIILVIMADLNNFTGWTWICLMVLTWLVALLFFIVQNFVKVGVNYQAYSDNFNLRFWLVVMLNAAVAYALKHLVNACEVFFMPTAVQEAMESRSKGHEIIGVQHKIRVETELRIAADSKQEGKSSSNHRFLGK